MTSLVLLVATVLVVTGAVAAAGTTVPRARAIAAVGSGAVLLVVADSTQLTAGATTRNVATAGRPLLAALLVVVVLGLRSATALALVGGVLAGPIRQLFEDPFHDPGCLGACDPNPLVLVPDPRMAELVQVVGGGLLFIGLLASARSREPRALAVAATALVAVAATAAGADGQQLMLLLACAGAGVLVTDLVRSTSTKARLTNVVARLTTSHNPETVLAEALDGRPISLGFRIGNGGLVDSAGRPMSDVPPGWSVVDIEGPAAPLAQLRADLTGVPLTTLAQVLRGPVRLALENSRLAAEAAARAEEVRGSAARLVEIADCGRRRLERDLHDGAQRHVLTLGMAVQAEVGLAPEARDAAAGAVHTVLRQLRDVAHGIRPPQLDTGGLGRGLAVLADRSTIPLDVASVPAGLEGPPAEACYRLVEDVLRTADGPVTVTVGRALPDAWTITVVAAEGGRLSASSSDRFRALGGVVESAAQDRGWRHVGRLPRRLS
jgi:signal transduction histidine kinase